MPDIKWWYEVALPNTLVIIKGIDETNIAVGVIKEKGNSIIGIELLTPFPKYEDVALLSLATTSGLFYIPVVIIKGISKCENNYLAVKPAGQAMKVDERKAERYHVLYPVIVEDKKTGSEYAGVMIDISWGGAKITLQNVPEEIINEVIVKVPLTSEKGILYHGKVVWREIGTDKYTIGVSFDESHQKLYKKFAEFVK